MGRFFWLAPLSTTSRWHPQTTIGAPARERSLCVDPLAVRQGKLAQITVDWDDVELAGELKLPLAERFALMYVARQWDVTVERYYAKSKTPRWSAMVHAVGAGSVCSIPAVVDAVAAIW